MDATEISVRTLIGLALVSLGVICLCVSWAIVIRYAYQRAARLRAARSSMIGPGSLLVWAGAYLSRWESLSFVGWWLTLLDPVIYAIAWLPVYLLLRRARRNA
jgi:hypothetical protein